MTIELKSEQETAALGARLLDVLQRGDVVCLEGPLGAGKSTLARGLITAFCGAKDIPSPTYTLVETYEKDGETLWHFDLYRLEKPQDVWELGYEEALEEGVSIIEWPERIAALLDEDVLRLSLEIDGGGARRLTVNAPQRFQSALRRAGIA
ncbi:MAG: tRNA (adenosine(37)-N6)-threonylcarbamoyltransferase complex ATPase subunit type 1 TsaE [Hyphococcus sp.]